MGGASNCPPLREIPEWCGSYGAGFVELANALGWGNTCLPLTEQELLDYNGCLRRETLTDPEAIRMSLANDDEIRRVYGADADLQCVKAHPLLYKAMGTTGCSIAKTFDEVPSWALWAFGGLVVLTWLRK